MQSVWMDRLPELRNLRLRMGEPFLTGINIAE
jgi:hypothetical protein